LLSAGGEIIVTKRKKPKLVHVIGRRKRAVARATARPGKGLVYINMKALGVLEPEVARLMIAEPLILAGEAAKNLDININVSGGGIFGQAEAARQAIAKALVAFDPGLRETFLLYDRNLLVADARRTEPHKPSRSKKGPRRHKQRSKR
jgi:small subunit ribosomal protein S9